MPYFNDAFDESQIKIMRDAFQRACSSLNEQADRIPELQEIIARNIIVFMQGGERNPDALTKNAISFAQQYLRMKSKPMAPSPTMLHQLFAWDEEA